MKYDLQLLKLCLYHSVFWHWNNGAFSQKAGALKTIPENLLLGPLWSHWMGVWSESREGDLSRKKDTEKQACKGHRVTMWAYLLICHPSFLPALLCECLIWMVMLWDKGKSSSISCERWAHFGWWIINAFGGKAWKSFRERDHPGSCLLSSVMMRISFSCPGTQDQRLFPLFFTNAMEIVCYSVQYSWCSRVLSEHLVPTNASAFTGDQSASCVPRS